MTTALAPSFARGTVSPLQEIVLINETLKVIHRISYEINLLGLNAILIAHRCGEHARGFAVIAAELRAFARTLRQETQRIAEQSRDLIASTSEVLKNRRLQTLVTRTRKMTPVQARAFSGGLDVAMDDIQTTLRRTARTLESLLEDGEQQCMYGDVIARTARIEAAHASVISRDLVPLSDEFVGVMTRILPAVQGVRKAIRNWQHSL